jgi:choline-sulfatase
MPWLALALACRSAPPPNVLLVTLDTTRADALGAYGGPPGVTPRLDALAAGGFRFDRAYTVTPLTIPAHSSIHTGLLPLRHGVRDNGDGWLPPEATTLAERLRERGYATMASVGAEVTSRHWGFDQGFDAYFDAVGAREDRWRAERPGEEVVDDALRWLTAAPPDRPWFAWVHLFDAHFPYAAPEPHRTAHPDPYRAEIAHLDAVVGRLLDGVPAPAWIVVVADHGEALGDHGEAMHGALLYDPTTRIPWIVRPPEPTDAQVIDVPVSLVDLAPTVLGLAGAPPLSRTDGYDLSRVLTGGEPPPDRPVLVESLYGWLHFGWAPQRAWVDGTHKLIDSATPELYARADPAEAHDLAAAEPDRLRAMSADLDAYRATRAPAFDGGPDSSSGGPTPTILDDARRAQLAALGYLAPEPAADRDPEPDGLLDARRGLPVLRDLERARQARQRGDTAGAEARLAELLARDPDVIDARLMLAGLARERGDSDAALAILDPVLSLRPSPRARVLAGALRLQRGELDQARVELEAALAGDPASAVAWDVYLTVLVAQGDAPALAAAVDDARRRLPDDPHVAAFAALLQLLGGEAPDDAPLRAALALGPHPFFHYGLGLAAARRGDDVGAEEALLEEVASYGPAIPARRALVALFADQRRYEEQLHQLNAIAAAEPPSVDTMHSRAQALFNLGRYADAEAAVAECRAFDPSYAPCAMLVANVQDKLGRPDAARQAYREALQLAPGVPSDPR